MGDAAATHPDAPNPPTPMPAPGPHTMRCLEVWGGNQAVDNGVVMAGLDAWLYSRPYRGDAAGGDIHYVSSCAAGMVTRVLVADVSGHGETVAETAANLRELMRRYVNFIDQSRFVQELNAEFGALSQAGGFATAVVGTYLAPDEELQLCNAGHPRPLWYRAKTRMWQLMKQGESGSAGPANTPLGVVEGACYEPMRVRLATGDVVVLYTDSLIEARDASGRQLGEEGLLEVARGLDARDPGELLHGLLNAVASRTGGMASEDDVTVLILRPNGLRPRMSIGANVKATARMFRELASSLRPRGPEFPAPEEGLMARVGAAVNRRKKRAGQ
jgi:phosphoserine phosphatase RsbU/P